MPTLTMSAFRGKADIPNPCSNVGYAGSRTNPLFIFARRLPFSQGQISPRPTTLSAGPVFPIARRFVRGFRKRPDHGVRFGGNSVRTVRLLCPFLDTRDLEVAFTGLGIVDQDGTGAEARVRTLIFVSAKIGTNVSIADRGNPQFNSNTANIHRAAHQLCQIRPHYKTRGDEWYWWDIVIERTNPQVNVEFLGVGGGLPRRRHPPVLRGRCFCPAVAFGACRRAQTSR